MDRASYWTRLRTLETLKKLEIRNKRRKHTRIAEILADADLRPLICGLKERGINMEQIVLEQLESLNPDDFNKVKCIIENFYKGQLKVKEADPWILSIIERVDLSNITLSDYANIETIKTVLTYKLGKQYYDLLFVYFLEIGKLMATTQAEIKAYGEGV